MSAPLQKLVRKGNVSQSVVLRAYNQISFVPQTSLGVSQAGLVLRYYRVQGGTDWVSFPQTALGSLSSSFTAGGWIAIADGFYRVDVPDAAWAKAGGVDAVLVDATATALVFEGAMVQLIDGKSITSDTPETF